MKYLIIACFLFTGFISNIDAQDSFATVYIKKALHYGRGSVFVKIGNQQEIIIDGRILYIYKIFSEGQVSIIAKFVGGDRFYNEFEQILDVKKGEKYYLEIKPTVVPMLGLAPNPHKFYSDQNKNTLYFIENIKYHINPIK